MADMNRKRGVLYSHDSGLISLVLLSHFLMDLMNWQEHRRLQAEQFLGQKFCIYLNQGKLPALNLWIFYQTL